MEINGEPVADKVLPPGALRLLPLRPQPLTEWSTAGDLHQFLVELYTPGGYQSHGRYLFEEGCKSAERLAIGFQQCASAQRPPPAARIDDLRIPDFRLSPDFGLAAKSLIAYQAIVEAMLEESAFFSITHLLESDTDIECSVLLAEHLYYKQALQALRNLLEVTVLPVHFCGHPGEFAQWRADRYRVPRMRGTGGMLRRAVQQGALSREVASLVEDLYDKLNEAVHASARHLIHRGVMEGVYFGYIFKSDDFAYWCNLMGRTVQAVALVLHAHLVQRERTRTPGVLQCDICHGTNLEARDENTFAEALYVTWRCPTCGSETTRRRSLNTDS